MSSSGQGVVYVATGEAHTGAARLSARSLLASNPGLPVAIFTDQTDPGCEFDTVLSVENAHSRSKVDCLRNTPFARTLYIDTDTRVTGDLSDLFRLLERFDIAAAHRRRKAERPAEMVWRHRPPEAFPEFNSGVMLFRSDPAVQDFFGQWSVAYAEAGFKPDQVTLRELLWVTDLRLAVLPPEYNTRHWSWSDRFSGGNEPLILHLNRFHPSKQGGRLKQWTRFLSGPPPWT